MTERGPAAVGASSCSWGFRGSYPRFEHVLRGEEVGELRPREFIHLCQEARRGIQPMDGEVVGAIDGLAEWAVIAVRIEATAQREDLLVQVPLCRGQPLNA